MFSSLPAGARSTVAIACGWQHVRVTTTTLSWDVVPVDKPDDFNVVIGQAHFIKTVEDLHEAMVGVSSSLRFGLAFCEASGPRLVRRTGNDPELVELATRNALAIAAGHCFVIFLRGFANGLCAIVDRAALCRIGHRQDVLLHARRRQRPRLSCALPRDNGDLARAVPPPQLGRSDEPGGGCRVRETRNPRGTQSSSGRSAFHPEGQALMLISNSRG